MADTIGGVVIMKVKIHNNQSVAKNTMETLQSSNLPLRGLSYYKSQGHVQELSRDYN